MRVVLFLLAAGVTAGVVLAEPSAGQLPVPVVARDPAAIVRVELSLERSIIQAGREVWAQFLVSNLTDEPVTLRVPDAKEDDPSSLMGLPLPHVFSGSNFSALAIINQYGDPFDQEVSIPPRGSVPRVVIAPHASVGTRVELTHYYQSLRRPGEYTLLWRPYHGQVISQAVTIRILAERQAVILTEHGKMTVRFHYNEAPNHVADFLELVGQKFYDNLTFNRVIPGALIQGGDPRGDRRGVRPDGKRLKAEFNKIPFEAGTVGMARSPRDPDSASCQFFICLSRQPGFDGQQTAFGYLAGEESFETLRKLAMVPTDSDDRPKQPIYIRAITLENVPLKESQAAGTQGPPGATQPSDGSPEAIRLTTRSASSGTEREITVRVNKPPASQPTTSPGE
ncbi:MAG TPA: peptidylprolyl isomerase [Phycisphaerae bacterium]|nr:peptidylprolyl isomerase [Phycisphaerae bacterium]